MEIISVGEPMVEFNRTGQGEGRLYLQGFGGDSSNFAIAAARQGASVGYVSALGDDRYGTLLRELWQREGVDARHVKTDAASFTAVYFVDHNEAGHHFSFYRAGSAASRMRPADLPLEAIAAARVLHVSGISLAISDNACDACFAAIEHARSNAVQVSFDTNLRLKLWPLARARAIMSEAMTLTDLLLPSLEDMHSLTGLTDANAVFDYCLRSGAKLVALKLGASGVLVGNAEQRIRIAAHPCNPVDATGAGDTFGGAFIARWVAGDDWLPAARYATVAAALSTEGYGAVEPIPRTDAVLRGLQASHSASESH
jgi:2-dehydro-3-deoxygluconokinase